MGTRIPEIFQEIDGPVFPPTFLPPEGEGSAWNSNK